MSNLNKTRQKLVDMYISSLEEDRIPWKRNWDNYIGEPCNAISEVDYNGANHLLLSFVQEEEGYKDYRWCTFKQAKDNRWKVKAGTKGVPIEFWSIYNVVEKKNYKQEDYKKCIKKDPSKQKDFTWMSKCYYVFNGDCIEGIPELPYKKDRNPIEPSRYINQIIKSLGVKYEEKGNKAYYSNVKDKVVIPPADSFFDPYTYYATQLHELCHATGHSSRLNRNQNGTLISYAMEELIAEISSSFLMQKIDLKFEKSPLDNHKAYVQYWIQALNDTPNELFKAIKDSDKIVDYIELELTKEQELEEKFHSEFIYPMKKNETSKTDLLFQQASGHEDLQVTHASRRALIKSGLNGRNNEHNGDDDMKNFKTHENELDTLEKIASNHLIYLDIVEDTDGTLMCIDSEGDKWKNEEIFDFFNDFLVDTNLCTREQITQVNNFSKKYTLYNIGAFDDFLKNFDNEKKEKEIILKEEIEDDLELER